jgi:sigma-B regulation protein RsbU (phosphoserine phosphatase)
VALLSRLNRLQRITIYLFALFWVNLLIARFVVSSPWFFLLNVFVALLFVVFLPFATLGFLFRRITWRVRNRLFVTYFLVGVLPIFLIFLFVQIGFYMLLGQTTNYLLRTELDRRIEDLAQGNGSIVPTPAWSTPGHRGVVKNASGAYLLVAHTAEGAFLTRPFDEAFLASLLPGLASVQLVDGVSVGFRFGARNTNRNVKIALDSENVMPSPPSRGWWDNDLESAAPIDIRALEDGKKVDAGMMSYTHPSAVLTRIFGTLGPFAGVLGIVMGIIAAMFLIVEIAAVIASIQLSRTLTSTVHDLYTGTKKVESGDFSHRIPVRAKDQLSELASSFNGMTERIEQLIVEVKDKEKLESELEIARQVQAQLFPKEVPKLASLELAGVCNPARVVSGDYYDFIPIASRGAAVVVGDISGKGISAALLMASVQASLHAQLAMDSDTDVSPATLVTRLNRQLYANTPPEKYATFYCAVYDDRNNRLSYTNAGHLAPILIRNGQAIRLESNGTVVGIFPEYPFEQATIDLQSGDLLAIFTDGITESEDAREEQYGDDRLIALLTQNTTKPLNEIIQLVMDTIGSWAHDPAMRDDITMLLARKL